MPRAFRLPQMGSRRARRPFQNPANTRTNRSSISIAGCQLVLLSNVYRRSERWSGLVVRASGCAQRQRRVCRRQSALQPFRNDGLPNRRGDCRNPPRRLVRRANRRSALAPDQNGCEGRFAAVVGNPYLGISSGLPVTRPQLASASMEAPALAPEATTRPESQPSAWDQRSRASAAVRIVASMTRFQWTSPRALRNRAWADSQ